MGFGSSRHAYADCNRYSDCNCNSDTYSAANSDRLANSHVHSNGYFHRYGNCYRNSHSHAYTHADTDSETHAYAKNYACTKAAGDSPASAVTAGEHWWNACPQCRAKIRAAWSDIGTHVRLGQAGTFTRGRAAINFCENLLYFCRKSMRKNDFSQV
jgi:hypothetical protein